MKNLFNGPSHSDIVGRHATKMQHDIDSRDIGEFAGLSNDEIEAAAAKFATTYSQFDVPQLTLSAQQKVLEKITGRRVIEVPFVGDASYFEHSPTSHETNLKAEIENGVVRVVIAVDSNNGLREAEGEAERTVIKISAHLKQLEKDLAYLAGAAMLNTARRAIKERIAFKQSEHEYKVH